MPDGQDTSPPQLEEAVADDALTGIKIAIGANMLPSRDSVHAADLVNRALQSADPPGNVEPTPEPGAMLVTTPWNDETLLLWVAVPSLMIADMTTVSVEFDPKTVATFRPLGNPSALPVPAAIPGWYGRAAMLYELSLQPDIRQPKSNAAALAMKYGVIHVSGAASGQPKIDRVDDIYRPCRRYRQQTGSFSIRGRRRRIRRSVARRPGAARSVLQRHDRTGRERGLYPTRTDGTAR